MTASSGVSPRGDGAQRVTRGDLSEAVGMIGILFHNVPTAAHTAKATSQEIVPTRTWPEISSNHRCFRGSPPIWHAGSRRSMAMPDVDPSDVNSYCTSAAPVEPYRHGIAVRGAGADEGIEID